MKYRISQLAQLAGVSQRTLRYYEQQGLLTAERDPENNYRWFDQQQVDRLQQILFYRELDFPLATIKQIMLAPAFDLTRSLQQQEQKLLQERARLDRLLAVLRRTQQYQKGVIQMTDQEKFQAFKKQQVTENEKLYGPELQEKYGEKTVQAANQHWLGLSQEQVAQMQALEADLFKQLRLVRTDADLNSSAAQQAFTDHRDWLQLAWGKSTPYSAATHRGLAAMYAADSRFQKYYDQAVGAGTTALLVKIIERYAK